MPRNSFELSRQVLNLRESATDPEAFARDLETLLSFSPSEASALAGALGDRFLGAEEQLNLLASLEMRGRAFALSAPSTLLHFLSGADGREALRHHARRLTDSLALRPAEGEAADSGMAALTELASLLPAGSGALGFNAFPGFPAPTGMYHYLRSPDSFLEGLVAELRSNLGASENPVLRMRSARTLALLRDRSAGRFLRDSEAALAPGYSGGLTMDERVARAAGLAVDGHEGAIRFLQSVALNRGLSTGLRALALTYSEPEGFEADPPLARQFRARMEDPSEAFLIRYLIFLLLARGPYPPTLSWEEIAGEEPRVAEALPEASAAPAADPIAEEVPRGEVIETAMAEPGLSSPSPGGELVARTSNRQSITIPRGTGTSQGSENSSNESDWRGI